MIDIVTLWIHRASASGILVHCSSNEEAYDISHEFLLNCSLEASIVPWDFQTFPDKVDTGSCFHSGCTPDVQVSIHPGSYVPAPFWSDYGKVLISGAEAVQLGATGEPYGFQPGESSLLWTRETRTSAELDQELDDYFQLGEIELKQLKYRIIKLAAIFGDTKIFQLLQSKDINYLRPELEVAESIYNDASEEYKILIDDVSAGMRYNLLGPE
jgi:hypothetical protein